MAEIEVGQELETATHWAYDVRVFDEGRTHDFAVTLSFQDYDLWSRGQAAPSRVVEACFEFLLANEGADEISPKFDCSVIRRYFPDVDAELPGML
ncbi:hypothetical protein OT109_05630 [Phycisphaeraceae bacterium D3-23]